MDIVNLLIQGFLVAIEPINLGAALAGAFIGTLIGAVPGMGPVNGIAMLLPIVYALGLPAETAMISLTTIFFGAEYGGRISSILLNIPGSCGALMSSIDGYPMAQRGLAGSALAISGIASFVGSILSIVGLTLFSPALTELAIQFGPAEYFALICFAFASLSAIADKNPVKTLISAVLGLMLATIGVDSGTGVERYTYGEPQLHDGIDFLIVVIGLFAISEIMLFLERAHLGNFAPVKIGRIAVKWQEVLWCKWTLIRSSLIGFFIGLLPGTGSSMASVLAYTTEKSINNRDDSFGKGNPIGLIAPETANNAAVGGSIVPTLTLGIPGSATCALLLGALGMYNIGAGPLLFSEHPRVAGGMIASMYVANLMLLVLNFPLVGLFAKILSMPTWLLVPGIVALSFIGVYSVHGSILSLFLTLAVGVFGYCLHKLKISLVPLILGFVLSDLMENNLRRALTISGGNVGVLFESKLSQIMWILTLSTIFVLPGLRLLIEQRRKA